MNEFEDFKQYFNRAIDLRKRGDIKQAIDNIAKAIEIAESFEQCSCTNNPSMLFITQHQVLVEMYFLAGELYAMDGKEDLSLCYYKRYQYYNSFIDTKFSRDSITLFSFRKFSEYSLSDLINNEITVCPSYKMNDPVDSLINLWLEEDNITNLCKDKKHIEHLSKSFDFYRIRSFCTGKGDSPAQNVLMWAHYADEHKGFCIKYRLSDHFIKEEETTDYSHMYLTKIHYQDERISVQVETINTKLAFATKSKDWEYENEVRLIVYNPNKTEDFYGIELDDDSTIEAIYFGYRCPKSTIITIQNIVKKIIQKTQVKFYKMKPNYSNVYQFRFEEI